MRSGMLVLIVFVLAVLALGGSAAVRKKLDVERYHADDVRLQKLRDAALVANQPTENSNNWPQWRGPNRDGLSLEVGLLHSWPEAGPKVLWEVPVGRGLSSVAVAAGRVYTMMQVDGGATQPTYETVICWEAATGKEVWRFRYPNSYEERFGSGPRSTPAVADGLVYTVGPTGLFHCLRADTGEQVWRHDLLEEFGAQRPRYGMSCSPLVEGDLVYTMPGGPQGGAVAAFDRHNGRLVWKALDDPIGYSSPILSKACGTRQLLVLTNTALVSLQPTDGHVLWRHPWQAPGGFNIAMPLVLGDYVFLSSGYGKGCTLLEIHTNADGILQASPVYEHNRMRNTFASSVCYQNHVYGIDKTDLVCLDVRTGKVLWRQDGRNNIEKGSLLIADGQLIVLGEHGRLSLAEASPAGYHEQSAFEISTNKCWTVPVIAGGRLFFRDEGRLVCLNLRPEK
jgi:outer membrane protein assembly factor BamB